MACTSTSDMEAAGFQHVIKGTREQGTRTRHQGNRQQRESENRGSHPILPSSHVSLLPCSLVAFPCFLVALFPCCLPLLPCCPVPLLPSPVSLLPCSLVAFPCFLVALFPCCLFRPVFCPPVEDLRSSRPQTTFGRFGPKDPLGLSGPRRPASGRSSTVPPARCPLSFPGAIIYNPPGTYQCR
jgi:hypothetical protein